VAAVIFVLKTKKYSTVQFYTSMESLDYCSSTLVQKYTHIFVCFFVIIMLLKLLENDAGGTSRAEKLQKNSCFKLKYGGFFKVCFVFWYHNNWSYLFLLSFIILHSMIACVRPINSSFFNIHSVDNLYLALSVCSVFSHLLHFFWHFMGIENSRNSYLDFPFFLLGFFKGAFALLREYTGTDDSDLFLEEREGALKKAQEEKRKIQIAVPGILNPHEMPEEMQEM
jgi:hypothetical protein